MTYLRRPFFSYGSLDALYPGQEPESPRDRRIVEVSDHLAGDGKRYRYVVGSRRVIELSFRWQDDALVTQWLQFWDAVKGGAKFIYYDDDSVPKAGSSTIAGSSTVAGKTSSGSAVVAVEAVMDSTEFVAEQEDVDGYSRVSVTIREAA